MKETWNNSKVYKHMKKDVVNSIDKLSEKDLVMALMGISHLDNVNNMHILGSTSVSVASVVASAITHVPAIFAVMAGSVVGVAYTHLKEAKLKSLEDVFVTELVNRYGNPQQAYLEISSMIQSISREELVTYLKALSE